MIQCWNDINIILTTGIKLLIIFFYEYYNKITRSQQLLRNNWQEGSYYNHDISSLKGFRENENLDQFRKNECFCLNSYLYVLV